MRPSLSMPGVESRSIERMRESVCDRDEGRAFPGGFTLGVRARMLRARVRTCTCTMYRNRYEVCKCKASPRLLCACTCKVGRVCSLRIPMMYELYLS